MNKSHKIIEIEETKYDGVVSYAVTVEFISQPTWFERWFKNGEPTTHKKVYRGARFDWHEIGTMRQLNWGDGDFLDEALNDYHMDIIIKKFSK